MTIHKLCNALRGKARWPLNIMVDIDDVLFPWADSIHERCRLAGLHDGTKPYSSWSMWEDYGVSKEAWLEVCDAATVDGLYHEPPYPTAAPALQKLVDAGHTVNLVTARGFMSWADEIREWTTDWVKQIPHHTLTFAKDKVAAQAELGWFDYAVDDGVHNFVDLHLAGVRTFLVDRPHNQQAEVRWAPEGERVRDITHFVDIVLQEEA